MNPSSRFYRYLVLVSVALIPLGSYFAYDSVSAMVDVLMKALNVGQDEIAKMSSMYSIAAIFTVLIGGVLIDRLGTRRASVLFAVIVTAGAAIMALAKDMNTMYIGRLIFGAGAESMIVAQSAIFTRWFKGKELAFAFGFGLVLCRVGTTFSFNTEAMLAGKFGHVFALWVAAGFCAFSLLCSLAYYLLDAHAEKILKMEKPSTDKVVFSDIKAFPASFWYITALCVVFYSAVFPFTGLSSDFIHDKWGYANDAVTEGSLLYQVAYNFVHMFSTAPGITSIVITASMIFALPTGKLVDKIGKRSSMMVLGALLLIPAHLILGFTNVTPQIPMIVLGGAFVLVPAAMWPSVSLVVDSKRTGTAFGLMTMIQNGGLWLFLNLNGQLRESTGNYSASMLMFAGLGVVGLIFALLMFVDNKRKKGVLELSAEEIKRQQNLAT